MDVVREIQTGEFNRHGLFMRRFYSIRRIKRFGQSYQKSIELFDYVVIMAYPYQENSQKSKGEWFAKLVVNLAKAQSEGH